MLSCHVSRRDWLWTHHWMVEYVETMRRHFNTVRPHSSLGYVCHIASLLTTGYRNFSYRKPMCNRGGRGLANVHDLQRQVCGAKRCQLGQVTIQKLSRLVSNVITMYFWMRRLQPARQGFRSTPSVSISTSQTSLGCR